MSATEKNTNPNENREANQNQDQNRNQNSESNSNQTPGMNSNTNSNADSNSNREGKPFEITGNWGKQSTQLKQQHPELTDTDLKFEPGKENELLDKIGTKLNKSRDEVIDIINRFEV
ncbi:hypothetical protein [Fluviicola taffensis]|uniref:hypothetical protein n=1 Tax=Fluviicola taffensis TaxID=191579 RepID=UPI003137FC29